MTHYLESLVEEITICSANRNKILKFIKRKEKEGYKMIESIGESSPIYGHSIVIKLSKTSHFKK